MNEAFYIEVVGAKFYISGSCNVELSKPVAVCGPLPDPLAKIEITIPSGDNEVTLNLENIGLAGIEELSMALRKLILHMKKTITISSEVAY